MTQEITMETQTPGRIMSRLETGMKYRQITYRGIGDRAARAGGPLKPAKEAAHAVAANSARTGGDI